MATTKKPRGRPKKRSASKSPGKKTEEKAGKNKLGVKNSLINNINARKNNGTSKPRKKSTVSEKAYRDMQNNWGRDE